MLALRIASIASGYVTVAVVMFVSPCFYILDKIHLRIYQGLYAKYLIYFWQNNVEPKLTLIETAQTPYSYSYYIYIIIIIYIYVFTSMGVSSPLFRDGGVWGCRGVRPPEARRYCHKCHKS